MSVDPTRARPNLNLKLEIYTSRICTSDTLTMENSEFVPAGFAKGAISTKFTILSSKTVLAGRI